VPLVAIDLFCGAGGLSCAFFEAGFDVIVGVESDPRAGDTYQESFINRRSPTTTLIRSRIEAPATLEKLDAVRDSRPVDVLLGGPPCQDFSPARLKRRRSAARSSLIHDYLRLLRAVRPRAFLFENVPGLQAADGGRHWGAFRGTLQTLGYRMLTDVLDAQNYGVPQRRRRLFVVGVSNDCGEFSFPEPQGPPKGVMDAIGHLPPLRAGERCPEDTNHRARKHRAETVAYLRAIPPGGSWRDAKAHRVLDCHKGHTGHYDVYGRMEGNEVAPTITGGCTNPSKGRFIHPTQHRGLTVREAALLQTFPEDWTFLGGVEAASQQVGNAVPVRLGRALAERLRASLTATAQKATAPGKPGANKSCSGAHG